MLLLVDFPWVVSYLSVSDFTHRDTIRSVHAAVNGLVSFSLWTSSVPLHVYPTRSFFSSVDAGVASMSEAKCY